jgi:hypothetical protein
MSIFRLAGFFAIIPVTILLTISFFVLFTLRKIDNQGLKAFGYVVAALLWVAALLVFSVGIYTISTGRHPMLHMMKEMIGTAPMCANMAGAMGGQPGMMQSGKCMGMKGMMQGMANVTTAK